jgi:hypothetical protein
MPDDFDPRDYGRLRAEATRAHQRELAALHASMSTAAARDAYRATSGQLRAAHRGIYDMTPQELAAEVAERSARVGDSVGAGRDLVAQGGTYNWRDVSDSPAPAPADLRWVNQPTQRPTGKSPLAHWAEGNSNGDHF